MTEQIKRTLTALEKNNMTPYFAKTADEVWPIVESLLNEGDSIGLGGSVTLDMCGIIDKVRAGNYRLIDRYDPSLSREEVEKCFKEAFFADAFLSSSNAITENGELVNVDGNSNRVAAILYGPESVIIVAGVNKIVPTVEDGFLRIKKIAAPKNTVRLGIPTYCNKMGECVALKDGKCDMTDGCLSSGRICCSYTVCGPQRKKGRIKVIICGESLGY